MIRLYCLAHHSPPHSILCTECETLLQYAHGRIERCPLGTAKKSCRKCSIHCYNPEMKARIREVMRYAGPRMLFHAPRLALLHLVNELGWKI